jgi:hypothetical protein
VPNSLLSLPIAGIVVDFTSSIFGMILLLTGVVAGAFRTLAVLGRSSSERAEWLTALGFLGGVAVAGVLLALDAVFG